VFEGLETPEQLYNFALGAALKMEHTVLEMLEDNAKAAQDSKLADLFGHHQDETREQIANLEQAFQAFGWPVDDSPCPAIEGIAKNGKANVKKADGAVVDDVLLAGAAETEHYEIAVYEGLITHAHAMGKGDVVDLLQQNLEQERHTLEEVKQATEKRHTLEEVKQPTEKPAAGFSGAPAL
jgi:ferritin-like metal-binding protein YciE